MSALVVVMMALPVSATIELLAPRNLIFDPAVGQFFELGSSDLSAANWREQADDLLRTNSLVDGDILTNGRSKIDQAKNFLVSVPALFWLTSAVLMLWIYWNFRVYRQFSVLAQGRVFLSREVCPPRESHQTLAHEIVGTVIIGLLCNALFATLVLMIAR